MFRAIFPPGNDFRHATIKMFPSTSEAALAAELRSKFNFEEDGGWIMESKFYFPTSPLPVNLTPNSTTKNIFAEVGSNKSGIVELDVQTQAQVMACTKCGRPIAAIGPGFLEAIKNMCHHIHKEWCMQCLGGT